MMSLPEKKIICQQLEMEVLPEVDVVVAGGGTGRCRRRSCRGRAEARMSCWSNVTDISAE